MARCFDVRALHDSFDRRLADTRLKQAMDSQKANKKLINVTDLYYCPDYNSYSSDNPGIGRCMITRSLSFAERKLFKSRTWNNFSHEVNQSRIQCILRFLLLSQNIRILLALNTSRTSMVTSVCLGKIITGPFCFLSGQYLKNCRVFDDRKGIYKKLRCNSFCKIKNWRF